MYDRKQFFRRNDLRQKPSATGRVMRHFPARIVMSSVLLATVGLCLSASAQTQKKTSVWDRIKQAAQQGQQPSGQQQPQQQPGQKPPKPGQQHSASAPTGDFGPFKPPAGTKIEEKIMAPVQEHAKFEVSPHGVHVATIETDGSRAVVWYDGVEGPKFDEILPQNGPYSVAFSPDGNRYAYCARSGNQLVVVVDGKELGRSSESVDGHYDANNCDLGFTQSSKHVYYRSWVNLGTERGKSFLRFVFDGKPSPPGSVDKDSIAISPDGEHYAYDLTISDPRGQDRYEFAVDGKVQPYVAGGAQWTNDSKHVYTQRHVPNNNLTELLFDGKPIARAFNFRIYVAPVGDVVVTAVTGGANFHPVSFLVVNGKKVPGSDTVERGMIHDVVFSPDGKHYAAHYEDLSNHHSVFLDGKRQQEYSFIDKLAFTPDSSSVVYVTQVNGKMFIVVGDKEYGGSVGSVMPPVLAPIGNRVGAFILTNNSPNLLMDGKVTPLNIRGGSDLKFTPDGAHYAYVVSEGGGLRLAIDGMAQQQSALSNDRPDPQDPSVKYLFSADSKHIAHFAVPPTPTGDYQRGVFLDGKYVQVSSEGTCGNLVFSPDSKHLFWVHMYGNNPDRLFIDGRPLMDFYTAGTLGSVPHWLDFAPDGALSFLAQDDNSLKRITITPSDQTSLATMLGGGVSVASGGN
jgi:hypothetical protein